MSHFNQTQKTLFAIAVISWILFGLIIGIAFYTSNSSEPSELEFSVLGAFSDRYALQFDNLDTQFLPYSSNRRDQRNVTLRTESMLIASTNIDYYLTAHNEAIFADGSGLVSTDSAAKISIGGNIVNILQPTDLLFSNDLQIVTVLNGIVQVGNDYLEDGQSYNFATKTIGKLDFMPTQLSDELYYAFEKDLLPSEYFALVDLPDYLSL